MAREFARLGILATSLFIAQGANGIAVGEFQDGDTMDNPAAASGTRDDWFDPYRPIDRRDISIDDDGRDRQRIETDLLTIPERFLQLTESGPTPGRADKIVPNINRGETRIAVRPRAFDPAPVCRHD